MASLPSGVVTFLLTDIEASTRRWDLEPEAMRAAMTRHDALFDDAVARFGGVVVKPRGEGDSRFAVYPRATDAVATAVTFQQQMSAVEWPTESPLRVRVALHTGEADLREGDYYGSTVNRAARLRSLAYGGQTLVSLSTAQLVRENLPDGASLLDLGQHRLKDLSWPEHVFQLVIPDVDSDFPPLLSLDRRPTNLPAQATPFIGREREINLICRWIQDPATRLVTVTGPGGSGKTRLALQVAATMIDEFPDGVFLVPLEAVRDPGLLVQSIVQAIGVRETSGVALSENLYEHLRDKRMLLVLDNFEHLVAAGPEVTALLAANPGLNILVTSREALRVQGEQELFVPALGLPPAGTVPPVDRLAEYEAIALFVSRAKDVKPDFELTAENATAVVGICQRLDGLPLAIELAAARVRMFPPRVLLKRLDRTLPLLTGGARDLPARQQTLRGAIAWSYDLLADDERRFFRSLSVFAGGFTPAAAEAVVTDSDEATPGALDGHSNEPGAGSNFDPWAGSIEVFDGIETLLGKSLLSQQSSSGQEHDPRFIMLETIREFGLELLTGSGELGAARRRHAGYFLMLAEMAEPELQEANQGLWLERLEADHRNLHAALTCAFEERDVDLGLRLTSALWPFWEVRGYFTEGRYWTERMLTLGGEPIWRARTLTGAGTMAWSQGDYQKATQNHTEALERYREVGKETGVAFALANLGMQALAQGDLARAEELFQDAEWYYKKNDKLAGIADVLNNRAMLAFYQNQLDRATELVEESLAIRRDLGDKQRIADALYNLGEIAYYRGDFVRAATLYRESLAMRRELGARSGAALCLAALAGVAAAQGDLGRGARLYGAAEVLFETTGISMDLSERARYDEIAQRLRAELGVEVYSQLREEGRRFREDEAFDFALTEHQEGAGSENHRGESIASGTTWNRQGPRAGP